MDARLDPERVLVGDIERFRIAGVMEQRDGVGRGPVGDDEVGDGIEADLAAVLVDREHEIAGSDLIDGYVVMS